MVINMAICMQSWEPQKGKMGFVSFPKSGKNEKLEILIILGVLKMMMIGFWLKMRNSLINEMYLYDLSTTKCAGGENDDVEPN